MYGLTTPTWQDKAPQSQFTTVGPQQSQFEIRLQRHLVVWFNTTEVYFRWLEKHLPNKVRLDGFPGDQRDLIFITRVSLSLALHRVYLQTVAIKPLIVWERGLISQSLCLSRPGALYP